MTVTVTKSDSNVLIERTNDKECFWLLAFFCRQNECFESSQGDPINFLHHNNQPCLDDEYIERLLDSSLKTAIVDAEVVIGKSTFHALCCSVQNAIVDMAYNLGRTNFKKFKKFKAVIEKRDWDRAEYEAKDSRWCGQVKTRCTNISKIIKAGCWFKQNTGHGILIIAQITQFITLNPPFVFNFTMFPTLREHRAFMYKY